MYIIHYIVYPSLSLSLEKKFFAGLSSVCAVSLLWPAKILTVSNIGTPHISRFVCFIGFF